MTSLGSSWMFLSSAVPSLLFCFRSVRVWRSWHGGMAETCHAHVSDPSSLRPSKSRRKTFHVRLLNPLNHKGRFQRDLLYIYIYAKIYPCVCVNHLKRYKTSNLGFLFRAFYKFAGGRSVMASLLPTKTLTIGGDTRLGQSGVPALLWLPVVQGLLPFNFYFAISACEWQPAKPRTGKTICFSLHVCTVVAICKFLDRGTVSFQFYQLQHWLWRR